MKIKIVAIVAAMVLTGCHNADSTESQTSKAVQSQQAQYLINQPIPTFRWSLERDLIIQLYGIRNMKAITYSVWRSDLGTIEGDCPSIGFGIPFDTSLTNPLMSTDTDQTGYRNNALTSIEQAEPNGIFASKNTAATWVMCAGENGAIDPVYVETKVTTYPYPVTINYETNRVTKAGRSSVSIKMKDQ